MKTKLLILVLSSSERGEPRWRVVLKRSGRVLLWSEHYNRRRSALTMARNLAAAFRDGWCEMRVDKEGENVNECLETCNP